MVSKAKIDDNYILRIAGELDIYNVSEVRKKTTDLFDDAVNHIIVDMSQLQHLDSSGLAFFMKMRKEAQERKISLVLKNMSPDCMNLFILTGLEGYFQIESA